MSSLSAETIEDIRGLYKRGFKLLEISRKLGVQKWQILRYTEDLPRQIKRLTTEEKEEITGMIKQGYTAQEIAQKFNIHQQTVYLVTRDVREINGREIKGTTLKILSELMERGYFVVPRKSHNYARGIKRLTTRFNIRKVGLLRGRNRIVVCFLSDRKEEALKAVLQMWRRKVTSYQELGMLAQSFGVKLKADEKRKNTNAMIKEIES